MLSLWRQKYKCMSSVVPQALYKKILEQIAIPCVDIVLLSDAGVLLLLRDNEPAKGMWWLPGGRILKGETIQEAASRKIQEEVGLVISPKKCTIVGVKETMFDSGPFHVSSVHTVNVVVVAKLTHVYKPTLDRLHTAFRFQKNTARLHAYVAWAIKESKRIIDHKT